MSQDLGAPAAVLAAVVAAGLGLLLILGASAGWWAARATPARTPRTP